MKTRGKFKGMGCCLGVWCRLGVRLWKMFKEFDGKRQMTLLSKSAICAAFVFTHPAPKAPAYLLFLLSLRLRLRLGREHDPNLSLGARHRV